MTTKNELLTHYCESDIAELMRGAPYLRLRDGGLRALLQETVDTGETYAHYLPQYPAVRIEPLDFLYQCRYNLDVLDEHMMADLLQSTWRQALWGAWLALLAPRPEYGPMLREIKGRHPDAWGIVGLAIAAHGGEVPWAFVDEFRLAKRIRKLVAALQVQPRALRKNPSPAELAAYRAEAEAVLATYRSGGAAAARPLTQKGLLWHYGENYWAWAEKNKPSAT